MKSIQIGLRLSQYNDNFIQIARDAGYDFGVTDLSLTKSSTDYFTPEHLSVKSSGNNYNSN
jgi:anti-sigma regulatory factor (Ser/Thr protein kinase)